MKEIHFYFEARDYEVFDVLHFPGEFFLCSQRRSLFCTDHCFPRKRLISSKEAQYHY